MLRRFKKQGWLRLKIYEIFTHGYIKFVEFWNIFFIVFRFFESILLVVGIWIHLGYVVLAYSRGSIILD